MWVTRLGLFLLLAFALFWLLFGISPANASGLADGTSDYQTVAAQLTSIEQTQQYFDTQTAEAYWQPLISSSTPVPTNSYWCPNGIPTGWGTVTPEAWWAMNCGQCAATAIASRTITATAFSTYFPTQTRTASVTPWATASATLYPQSTLRLITTNATYHGTPGGGVTLAIPISSEYAGKVVGIVFAAKTSGSQIFLQFNNPPVGGTWTNLNGYFPPGQWKMYASWMGAGYYQLYFAGLSTPPEGTAGSAMQNAFINYYTYADAFTLQLYQQYSGVTFAGMTNFGAGGNVLITDDSAQLSHPTHIDLRIGGSSTVIDLQVFGYIVWADSAAGTSTPVANYCAQVNNGESSSGGGGSIDLGIHLPEISVGPASCTTFGGWGFDWTDSPPLPAISFELPSVTLCFQPLSLGSFDLFGVAIDMNLFITIMGAAVLIRWALRS